MDMALSEEAKDEAAAEIIRDLLFEGVEYSVVAENLGEFAYGGEKPDDNDFRDVFMKVNNTLYDLAGRL